ncbi:DUF3105 domain-containing protein [Arthrobacter halodurans]|uniref:DUF3105 domain-containing protein n=1 Tax=Arthrobacter halodurans TaxID=516699 RepID=A0ABV4URA1_9MICC
MMDNHKNPAPSQRARAQAVVAQQQRKAKRTKALTIGVAAAAVLAIAVPTAVVIGSQAAERDALAAAAAQPIEGVQTFEIASSNHTEAPVSYPQSPGVGGDHFPGWANCGVYDQEVVETHAVHSLEHGAVWISYSEDASTEDVAALEELVGERTYLLLSPFAAQEEPIKLSAWGSQLAVDSPTDPRVETFIQKYRQGPQTPEPGAACTGGIDG